MSTFELKLPVWLWIAIGVFVILLSSNHLNALWVAGWLWHGAGHVVGGVNHGLTAVRTHSNG